MNGLNKRKINLRERGDLKKISLTFTIQSFFFLGNEVFYPKDDSHQKEFEEDLTLFISQELVQLAFWQRPYF